MSKQYIKQLEQNVIDQASFWNSFQEMISAMQYRIGDITDSRERKEFNEGFQLLREGAYKQLQFALARCFAVSGVGGEKTKQFSKQRAEKMFGGDYSVMQWLDKNFVMPSYWRTDEETEFKQELADAIKENKCNPSES